MKVNPVKKAIMRACVDAAYRKRLINNPRQVLAEEGVEVPEGVQVVVHEPGENRIMAVLPGPQSAELKSKKESLPVGKVEDAPKGLTLEWRDSSLVVGGRVDSETAPTLKRELLKAFADVELDLGGVEFLSSAGLSALLAAQKHLFEQDHELRLIDVTEPIRNVLDMAGFAGMFEIIDRQDIEQSALMAGWAPHGMPF